MFVIRLKEGHREYVGTSSPHWLNLLNDTVKNKQYATKFRTRKEAEQFKKKLEDDGYDFAGSSVYGKFSIVRM